MRENVAGVTLLHPFSGFPSHPLKDWSFHLLQRNLLGCPASCINLQEGCVGVRGQQDTGPVFVPSLQWNQRVVPLT